MPYDQRPKHGPLSDQTRGRPVCVLRGSPPLARPTKYRAEFADQAFKLCLLGATDSQLADFFGVTEQTVNNWKAQHPAFLESLKKGKLKADAEVAHSLYHRALGYSHPEEKLFQHEGEVIRANTVKQYPPDTAAAFIWLKNRAGWRDKQELEHAGKDGGPIETRVVRVPAVEKTPEAWAHRFAPHVNGNVGSTNGNGKHG